jgi:hypothetical protein
VSLDPSISGRSRDIAASLVQLIRLTVRNDGAGSVQTAFGKN